MKITRRQLRKLINEEYALLVEQEEETGTEAEEEEGEDVGGEEALGAETEEEIEGAEGEEEDEEKEEEVEPAGEEDLSLGKTVDDELNALFIDFEADAIAQALPEETNESRRPSLIKLLFEQEEVPVIDMESFAGDIARLVKNYDSLLDMKALIMKKAQDFITDKYGEGQAVALTDILDFRYDLSLEVDEDMISPLAVGASSTAAEGGA